MEDDRLRTAVSAGVISAEEMHRRLLDSIVQAARAIFGARAASIMLFDEGESRLIFEAVAGEGSDRLLGKSFPATQGIAGWVLAAGQPLVIEDVSRDPRFARDVAERSGYVPKGLMAVPLQSEERSLGVLQVLDRPERSRFSLREMDVLQLFADQAAVALELVQHARRARRVLAQAETDVAVLARLSSGLDGLEGKRRRAAVSLLEALEQLLDGAGDVD
jgi:GAF domain-containing protein